MKINFMEQKTSLFWKANIKIIKEYNGTENNLHSTCNNCFSRRNLQAITFILFDYNT